MVSLKCDHLSLELTLGCPGRVFSSASTISAGVAGVNAWSALFLCSVDFLGLELYFAHYQGVIGVAICALDAAGQFDTA